MKITELNEIYSILELIEQEALQVIALIYEPHTYTDIIDVVRALSKSTVTRKMMTYYETKNVINELAPDFLLQNDKGHWFMSDQNSNQIVFHYCLKNPRLAQYRQVILKKFPLLSTFYSSWHNGQYIYPRVLREFRLNFLLNDIDSCINLMIDSYGPDFNNAERWRFFATTITDIFNTDLIERVPQDMREDVLALIISNRIKKFSPLEDIILYLKPKIHDPIFPHYFFQLGECYLLRGNFTELEALFPNNITFTYFLMPIMELLKGNLNDSWKLFSEEIEISKNSMGKKNMFPHSSHGLYF